MRRISLPIRSTFDAAAIRADNGAGRVLQGELFGSAGARESLAFEARTGTNAGVALTLEGLPEATAAADVYPADWSAQGVTLTLRVYRRDGQTRTLVTQGTTASGPTTVKGVAQNNPPSPNLTTGLPAGSYEVEVETDGVTRYAAVLEG